MTHGPHLQPVYASINAPLTIGGAERRLFLLALVLGAGTFTFFGSLAAGLVMFLALYGAARQMTQRDPQWLRIVLRSAAAPVRYDPAKLDTIRVIRGDGR
jgi:type IV secretory pathway TrbD component